MAALKPFGSTALYDAVLTALPMMNTRTKQRASVLIISDGADTASDAALREVRSALIRSDAFVYAIAVDPPAKRAINETVNVAALNEITGGSGGNTELVHQTADLVAATARIADELNSQYVLGYYSPLPLDGSYRSIRVRATNPEYRVRARRGYIATPRTRRPAVDPPQTAACVAALTASHHARPSARQPGCASLSPSRRPLHRRARRLSLCFTNPRPYSAVGELGLTTSACAKSASARSYCRARKYSAPRSSRPYWERGSSSRCAE